jgi:hypothetical protein
LRRGRATASLPPGAVALGHGELPRRGAAPSRGSALFFFFFPQYFLWFLAQNVLAKFIHILFHDVFSKNFVPMFVFRIFHFFFCLYFYIN